MSATPTVPQASELSVGDIVVTTQIPLSRADLVRYAGASGDFNYIHWNERFAQEVGLPNVIAHGMLTMGAAIAPITEWLGDPGRVIDYRTRFTAPVVVTDAESGTPETPTAFLDMSATVGAINEETGEVRLDVDVTDGQQAVLGRTQVKVSLA